MTEMLFHEHREVNQSLVRSFPSTADSNELSDKDEFAMRPLTPYRRTNFKRFYQELTFYERLRFIVETSLKHMSKRSRHFASLGTGLALRRASLWIPARLSCIVCHSGCREMKYKRDTTFVLAKATR